MDGPFKASRRGLKMTLAGSLVFHIILLGAAAFIFNAGPNKTFISPVYTVDLVGPQKVSPAPAPTAIEKTAPVEKAPVEAKKSTAPKAKELKEAKPKADVLIPDKTKKLKEDPRKQVEEKIKELEDDQLVKSSIESLRKKQELESKKNSERLDKIRKELNSKEAKKATDAPAPATPKGNMARGNLEAKYPAYFSLVGKKVHDNWIYPEGFDKSSIIISMKIGRSGNLIDSWVETSSGNRRFDESLINAIKKASPFPPLPHDFEGSYLEMGLRFCPSCK